MPAARGSRGPRRGRGSCPKLLCAYRGCRSKRDVKNLGKAFSAPRDAVTESQCRPLHGACQTVRFCGPTHRRLAMSRDARQRGPREALELGQYTLMIETCLKVGAPWLVPLTLLQLVCGERAECICHARFSWLNHLNPKDSNPATIRIPQVNRKTKTEGNSDGARRRRPLKHVDHERAPRGGGEPVAFCGPEDARPGHVPFARALGGR